TEKLLDPTIRTPGGASLASPSFFPNGPSENTCAQTVMNTSANVKVVKSAASSCPSLRSISAKYPETVSATIPRGAIHPINVFSLFVSSVPIVEIQMDKGRTIKSMISTKPMIGHVKISAMVSRDKEAVSRINMVDVKRTDMFSTK